MTKETGIIMIGSHPVDILEGRKIMTRRVVKPQPLGKPYWSDGTIGSIRGVKFIGDTGYYDGGYSYRKYIKCPYGQVGDRLWVREGFLDYPIKGCLYKADYNSKRIDLADDAFCVPRWKPSIFMPRWASRITLDITDIKVERVQEITEADTVAEGIATEGHSIKTPWVLYANLWDSLNAKRGYGWEVNPWVWVISFKIIKQ